MTKVHRIKVFKDEKDNFGDIATATFDEGRKISDEKRMEIARQLNTGETVFVNDKKSRNISIVHPQVEVDFAGVAALAAAWLFSELEGKNIDLMTSRGGEIIVSQDSDMTWVRASLSTMPPWNHVEMRSAKEVEDTKLADTSDWQHVVAWAWVDKEKGKIRARTFAADWDIPEAEGNGSGSMMLAKIVDKNIEIIHGEGSVIFAKPIGKDYAEIGGRVEALPSTYLAPSD